MSHGVMYYFSTNQGWAEFFLNSAECRASRWKRREHFLITQFLWTMVAVTFSKMIHFTEGDFFNLNYPTDLHYLERYLFHLHIKLYEHSWISFIISIKGTFCVFWESKDMLFFIKPYYLWGGCVTFWIGCSVTDRF